MNPLYAEIDSLRTQLAIVNADRLFIKQQLGTAQCEIAVKTVRLAEDAAVRAELAAANAQLGKNGLVITLFQAERTNRQRDLDKLKTRAEDAERRADTEKDDIERELEQTRVQLAGCLTAAEGSTHDPAKRGDYGWSLAYQKTLDLRQDLMDSSAQLVLDDETITTLRDKLATAIVQRMNTEAQWTANCSTEQELRHKVEERAEESNRYCWQVKGERNAARRDYQASHELLLLERHTTDRLRDERNAAYAQVYKLENKVEHISW